MNTVERIKAECKKRNIAISKLEKDLKFGNAYIGGLKKGVVPDDRLRKIAEYLNVTPEYLMTGKNARLSDKNIDSDVDFLVNDELRAVLESFKKLSKDNRENLIRYAQFLLLNDDNDKSDFI
jgi:transcriptional regulator with XRE-family HTH domain